MPCSPQNSSSSRLQRNRGENSFCTLARPPSPSTSMATSISSTLAFEMPTARILPSSFSAAKVSTTSPYSRLRSGRCHWYRSMTSRSSARSEASTARRMYSGEPSRPHVSPSPRVMPPFVPTTTPLVSPSYVLSASATTRSLWPIASQLGA